MKKSQDQFHLHYWQTFYILYQFFFSLIMKLILKFFGLHSTKLLFQNNLQPYFSQMRNMLKSRELIFQLLNYGYPFKLLIWALVPRSADQGHNFFCLSISFYIYWEFSQLHQFLWNQYPYHQKSQYWIL